MEYADTLREAFRFEMERNPFSIDALVILPDHLHTLWTLPQGDSDYSGRWKSIKSRFARLLVRDGLSLRQNSRGEYRLWQRRYWEHTIRDQADLAAHLDYIHFNPVKHDLVGNAAESPFSSFHRFVERGVYPADWAGSGVGDDGRFGE